MLKSGIGATEDTLRERAAAPGRRAQPRSQPRRGHRAVQRQQRHPRDATQLHRQPAGPKPVSPRHRSGTVWIGLTGELPFVNLEMHGARLAAERPTEGMEREAAERQAAEAARAAARKVVAISKDWWGSEMGEGEEFRSRFWKMRRRGTNRVRHFHFQVGPRPRIAAYVRHPADCTTRHDFLFSSKTKKRHDFLFFSA